MKNVESSLFHLVKRLPVSQEKWNKIVSRIKKVKKNISSLEIDFLDSCDIFLPLIKESKEQILEAIPEKYSHLDFYHRILLISCFRSDCIMSLLSDWISVNMGSPYANV